MSEEWQVADSIDRLTKTIKELFAQPEIVKSPLDGMDISSNILGWVRVEKALNEIRAFENDNDNACYETLITNLKKILMECKP